LSWPFRKATWVATRKLNSAPIRGGIFVYRDE